MCRPCRFENYADMTETPLRSITNSGTWMFMLVPTYSTMTSSNEPRCQGFNQSIYNSLCQSLRYLPETRSSVSQYLVQSRYRQVFFTPSVIQDPVANSLLTMLASFLWCCITEWALRYLSVIRSEKSQSWSMPTQQTPSEIPIEHLYDPQSRSDVW